MEQAQAAPNFANAPTGGPNEPLVLVSPSSDGKLACLLFNGNLECSKEHMAAK